jgi:hypothetical protein
MKPVRCAVVVALAAALIPGCAPPEVTPPTGAAGVGSTARPEPIPLSLPRVKAFETKPFTRSDPRRARIESAIAQVVRRDLRTDNGFWTVFHAILGLGPKAVTMVNPESGQRVNALDYISQGGEVRGMRFIPTAHGLDVQTGPQWVGQGHQDQFIAEMAQWNVSIDRPFRVQGRDYTFRDFVRHTQMRASTRQRPPQELSWAILVIGHYLGTDLKWTNEFGEPVTFDDLIRYEIEQPMDERVACGGTHRLFGLSWVYHLHLQKGGKPEGAWKDLVAFTDRHKALARAYQNADGSFSTSFFREKGELRDLQLQMNTTGHTLEWLALALSDQELRESWVERAADRLAQMFHDIEGSTMESGSLYHAVHGLLIYYARLYGPEWLGDLAPPVPLPPPPMTR